MPLGPMSTKVRKNGSSTPKTIFAKPPLRPTIWKPHIVIVGCGLGGLSAAYCIAQSGHEVTLIDSRSSPSDSGAGIQISPNATRLLVRWGLGTKLAAAGVEPEGVAFRRYKSGELVGYSRWGSVMRQTHGTPYYHIHRTDLHEMLFQLVDRLPNVRLLLGSPVTHVDPVPNPKVSVTIQSGETIECDLIIGADGVRSTVRNVVVGQSDREMHNAASAYRAVISTESMRMDPNLKWLLDTPEVTIWMGPNRHVIGYCIRGKKEYNLVAIHHEETLEPNHLAIGSVDEMHALFSDFDSCVTRLLSHAENVSKWNLIDSEPLDNWTHPSGRVVLLGDACHPMLPYRAQGAAMAIEDGAVVGSLLSRLTSHSLLPILLSAYEEIRRPRTTNAQLSSRQNQHVFHLPDGPAQERRDLEMRAAMLAEFHLFRIEVDSAQVRSGSEGNANQWADVRKNIEQFSYDADDAVKRWFASQIVVE